MQQFCARRHDLDLESRIDGQRELEDRAEIGLVVGAEELHLRWLDRVGQRDRVHLSDVSTEYDVTAPRPGSRPDATTAPAVPFPTLIDGERPIRCTGERC